MDDGKNGNGDTDKCVSFFGRLDGLGNHQVAEREGHQGREGIC